MVRTITLLDLKGKIKNGILFLLDAALGGIAVVITLIVLWLIKVLQGIFYIAVGAVMFYFMAGFIAWIACGLLAALGHAYLRY